MKHSILLACIILSFSSCEFLSNQNDLYAPLRISEIGYAYYQDEIEVAKLPYIELYNYGSEAVNLSAFTLRCSASILGDIQLYDGQFDLPDFTLEAGGYVLLRSGAPAHEFVLEDYLDFGISPPPVSIDDVFSSDRIQRINDPAAGIFYISRGPYFPYWTNYGFAEIIGEGQSVDFVRWGSSSIASPSNGSFEGTAPASYYLEIPYVYDASTYELRSIGRINEATDTDSGLDWKSYIPSTPGSSNDGAGL